MASERRNPVPAQQTQGNIRPSRLSKKQYTLSLLNEALCTGWLDNQEVHRIQREFMSILSDLIQRYTQGKSSSVTSDTAERILSSILYAVDANLRRFADPLRAVDYLTTADMRKIYGEGVDLLRQCLDETKRLYTVVKQNKLDVAVEAYHTTIDESLPVFLNQYGILFDAHNTMASIDYPLAVDDIQMEGVFYIREYVERLKMETDFCRLFSQGDLDTLLVHFGQVCRFDYRIELFNIFELVLNNAVFSILSGGDAHKIYISPGQFEALTRRFALASAAQIQTLLHEAADELLSRLNINDTQLSDYMHQCMRHLAQRAVNAARHHRLETVIIKEMKKKQKSYAISLDNGDQMTDSRFRLLVDRITACEKTEEKVDLIQKNVHSLTDYVDVLNAGCLFGNEFHTLFRSLSHIELAILTKRVFYEDLRDHSCHFSSIVFQEKMPESEWEQHYVAFLQNLGPDRLNAVEACIHDIDYEDISFD